MPALGNPRHERFAQELAKGKTADEAYEIAGLMPKAFGAHSGFYVYALIDPRDNKAFYIGKGVNKRAAAHWRDMERGVNRAKAERLMAIKGARQKVRIDILVDSLTNDQAFQLEQAFIRTIGFSTLTNILVGASTETTRLLEEVRFHLRNTISFPTWRRENPEKPARWYWDVMWKWAEMEGVLERKLNGATV